MKQMTPQISLLGYSKGLHGWIYHLQQNLIKIEMNFANKIVYFVIEKEDQVMQVYRPEPICQSSKGLEVQILTEETWKV